MGGISKPVVMLLLASIFTYLNVGCNKFLNIDYYSRYTCPSATVVDLGPVVSAIQCAILCHDDSSCMSLTYNRGTQECRGNMGPLLADNCTRVSHVKFYLATSRTGSFGLPCKSEGCFVDSMRCAAHRNKCVCRTGYSRLKVAQSCLRVCETYGPSYYRIPGPYFDENKWPQTNLLYITTWSQCQRQCSRMEPKVCKSIAWDASQRICSLRTFGYLDVPAEDRLWNRSLLYIHRQCD